MNPKDIETVCPEACSHLVKQHDHALELAQVVYKEPVNDGKLGMYLASEDSRLDAMWSVPVTDDHQKLTLFDTLALFLEHRIAKSYSVMMLAWMVNRTYKDGEEITEIRPSEQPDRLEILMVITQDENVSIKTGYQVVRDHAGAIKDFELVINDYSPDGKEGGNLSNLIEKGRFLKSRLPAVIYDKVVMTAENFLQQYVQYGEGISSVALASTKPKPH